MWEDKNIRPGNEAHVVHYLLMITYFVIALYAKWTPFILKRDSAGKGYSPKLFIDKVANYMYTNQEPVQLANINGQFMATRRW